MAQKSDGLNDRGILGAWCYGGSMQVSQNALQHMQLKIIEIETWSGERRFVSLEFVKVGRFGRLKGERLFATFLDNKPFRNHLITLVANLLPVALGNLGRRSSSGGEPKM